MFKADCHTAALSVAVFAAVSLSACGSSSHTKTAARQSATTQTTATVQPTAVQSASEQIAVAHVGGHPITKAILDHAISTITPKIASYEPVSRADCSSVRAPKEVILPKGGPRLTAAQITSLCERQHARALRERALISLISNEWVMGEAAAEGLRVSDSEAQRRLTEGEHKQFSSEAEFQKYLKTSGQTVSDLLSAIRLHLASERIRSLIKSRAGGVTRARILDYFNTHRSRYVVPERRDIEAIATATKPEIEKVAREVRSGVSFAALAKRLSIDRPSNEHGGVTVGVVRGQEEKGYDEAIFRAKTHVLTGPIYLQRRYYVFEVNRISPGHQQPLGEVEASIAQQLPTELQQQALARFIATWRKKWTAKTDCSPGYVVLKCRQYKASGVTPAQDPYGLD